MADGPHPAVRRRDRRRFKDRINDTVGVIREKMILHKFQRLERRRVRLATCTTTARSAVVLVVPGGAANDEVLRDVSAHIAALNPAYATTARRAGRLRWPRKSSSVMAEIADRPEEGLEAGATSSRRSPRSKLKTKLSRDRA